MASPTMTPATVLQQMIGGGAVVNLLYAAAELDLADYLRDGPLTSAELAARTGAHAGALHRLLRRLAMIGLVARQGDGAYALTPLGEYLRTDIPGSQRPFARLSGHPAIQGAWGALLHTVRTGEIAFDHANGTDFFSYLTGDPDLANRFNTFMGGITAQAAAAVVEAYDFTGITTLMDVGGGDGGLTRAVLRAYPQTTGIILDHPVVREQAEAAIAADGLEGRCRFDPGDFFTAVPAGADLYLLKSVIHDWDDARALAILTACRRALGPAGRLLLVEGLMSEDAPSPSTVMGDLIMLAMAPGRERTEAEFRALLACAGLTLTRIVPTNSGYVILEAMPAGV